MTDPNDPQRAPSNPDATDDDWDDLVDAWRGDAQPPTHTPAAADDAAPQSLTEERMKALIQRAEKDGKAQQKAIFIEVLAAAFVVVFMAVMMARNPSLPMLLLGGGAQVVTMLWLVALTWTMRDTWQAAGAATADFVALTRRRIKAQLRWTGHVYGFLVLMVAAFNAWAVWVWTQTDVYEGKPRALAIGVIGVHAICAGIVVANVRQRRKLRGELEALDAEVGEEDGEA